MTSHGRRERKGERTEVEHDGGGGDLLNRKGSFGLHGANLLL